MTRSAGRRYSAVAVVMATAAALAGCGSSSPAGTAASSSSVTVSPSPSPSTLDAAALRAAVLGDGLQASDLANHYTLKAIPDGDTVTGQLTLYNCGYTFTSEKHRVARHQSVVLNPSGQNVGVSNEVVGYDTAADAAQAMAEWQASVGACRKNVDIRPPLPGAPIVRYEVEAIHTEPKLPVAANYITAILLSVKASGVKTYNIDVMQQRGQILDIIWTTTTTAPPTAELNAILNLAAATGQHLAAS